MNKRLIAIMTVSLFLLNTLMVAVPVPAWRIGRPTNISKADASWVGEATNNQLGLRVNIIQDVNGDGYDDILMLSHNFDGLGTQRGKLYLFFGGPNINYKDMLVTNSNASWVGTIDAAGSNIRFGSAGDLNGDGIGDIFVLSGDSDTAWFVFGKRTGWENNLSLEDIEVSLHNQYNYTGMGMEGVGDVNGDGFDDIAIARGDSTPWTPQGNGEIALIFGRASGWTKEMNISQRVNARIHGDYERENIGEDTGGMGHGIAKAGDVNGDGLADFIVGSNTSFGWHNRYGGAYLILGNKTGWNLFMDITNLSVSKFLAPAMDDYTGGSLAGGGDLNGDGYDDFIIGSPWNNEGAHHGGMVYIINGRKDGWPKVQNLSYANGSVVGRSSDLTLGWYNDASGDLNRDGYDDLLLGTPWTDTVMVFQGSKQGIANNTSTWDCEAYFDKDGAEHAYLGESVSNSGDVNRDGVADLLISATWANVAASDMGAVYLFYPDLNVQPTAIEDLKAFTDPGYTNETFFAEMDQPVYIEMKATDTEPLAINYALVHVESNANPRGFTLTLVETGKNTGIFRGRIDVRSIPYPDKMVLGATPGALINVTYWEDPTVNMTLPVGRPTVQIRPLFETTRISEDAPYLTKYWNAGINPIKTWTYKTNASWMQWSPVNNTAYGTPDNGDVGSYSIVVSAVDNFGTKDEHNFTLTVTNSVPKIANITLPEAVQGKVFSIDCNADDEGQGSAAWSLSTNASWLSINTTSGVLSGTPGPYDVRSNNITINFTDGNGGLDQFKGEIKVKNVNDPPKITALDVKSIYEDLAYFVNYTATDPDVGDTLMWVLTTNASWLSMNTTGELFGTPENKDVGTYWVNVSVEDRAKAVAWHLFDLSVLNVNDRPVFISIPETTGEVLKTYRYQAQASDVDAGDLLTYSLVSGPKNLTVNSSSGEVAWAPDLTQKGTNHVVLGVTDGNVSIEQPFEIEVKVTKPLLLKPAHASSAKTTRPDLDWSLDLNSDLSISYDVYMDESSAPTTLFAKDLNDSFLTVKTPLKDRTTYYWSVVPKAQGPKGLIFGATSEIQMFSIDTGFIPDYTVLLELDKASVSIKRGGTASVLLKITNNGNMDGNITITITGNSSALDLEHQAAVYLGAKSFGQVPFNITVDKKATYTSQPLTIKISFGGKESTKLLVVTVKRPTTVQGPFSGQFLWVWILMVVAVAVTVAGAIYFTVRRKRTEREIAQVKERAEQVEDFNLDEIFLIYQDGRLISHVGAVNQNMDDQLFSSMLVAIQGFVKESFQSEETLSRFDYGSKKMILEKGQNLILAVALTGGEPKILKENMHALISKIEGLYSGVVENWDGNVTHFKDVNMTISPLFDIKKGLKIRLEKEEVTVKSGIEFFGGYVRLKVAVGNDLPGPIKDVALALNYDKRTLRISRIDPTYPMVNDIIVLDPVEHNEKRTVAIYFDPLICQESHVDATVQFSDSHGNRGSAQMKRRPVDVVCPIFYTPENINVAMLRRFQSEAKERDSRIYLLSAGTEHAQAYDIIKQAATKHDLRLVRELTEPAPYIGEAWYYGKIQNTNEEIVLKVSVRQESQSMEILAASSNLATITGLLAEIGKNVSATFRVLGLGELQDCLDLQTSGNIKQSLSLLDKYGHDGQGPK